MRRKQLLVLAGVALAVAVVVPAAVQHHAQGQLKTPFRAKYDLVRAGMTVKEVHAIMGEPALCYYYPTYSDPAGEVYGSSSDAATVPSGSDESARVRFAQGRVTNKRWGDSEPTWLESVRFRLGW
jgi:hypothetical protein